MFLLFSSSHNKPPKVFLSNFRGSSQSTVAAVVIVYRCYTCSLSNAYFATYNIATITTYSYNQQRLSLAIEVIAAVVEGDAVTLFYCRPKCTGCVTKV